MKHIFTEAAQGILTLDVQPTTWGAGWWVGSWGFSVMVFVAFGVFVVLVLLVVWVFLRMYISERTSGI